MKEGAFVHKISLVVLPRLVALIMRVLFSTCRITEHRGECLSRCHEQGKTLIATFWHYAVFYTFYHLRGEKGVVMVSASKDGEYIARLARCFDFTSVRGSSNKRGMRALLEMMKLVASGHDAGIVADGSQGPPLVAQSGSILLASKTGASILPMLWSASRYWAFNSWDRTIIPKPFSRIDFFYGEPISVPKDLTAKEVEEYRLLLEKKLNDVYNEAWALHGKKQH